MAARSALSYWSLMGLSAQTARWERAMTTNLVESIQALEQSAVLQATALKENLVADETLEEAEAEKEQASTLKEEAEVLLEESNANAALAARDELKVEELEERISALETESAAHAGVAAADEVLTEEESAEAFADTADAARIESQARGEELGIAFCELIPILDIACDVVGGVTAVGLETGAAAEAVKAAGEFTAAGATKVEEDREMALAAQAEESAVGEQSIAGELQAEATEKSELSEQEKLEAEEREVEAGALLGKAEADESFGVEEEATATADEVKSESQAAVAVEKGVAASWNAILAGSCGLLSLVFFLSRALMNVVVPGASLMCRNSKDKTPIAETQNTFARDASFILHHYAIFWVVAVSFQSLLCAATRMSLKARGGVLLSFACTAAFVQALSLHVIPRSTSRVEKIWQLLRHFFRHMLVLPLLFTIEILSVWVIFGANIFDAANFGPLLILLLWITLTVSLGVHIVLLEIPHLSLCGQRDAVLQQLVTVEDVMEKPIAVETDCLIQGKPCGASTTSFPEPSWFTLLFQDLCSLQIPLEVLILACLSRIVVHSTNSLKLIWPMVKPMLIHSRPMWIDTIAATLICGFLYMFAFSMWHSSIEKRELSTKNSTPICRQAPSSANISPPGLMMCFVLLSSTSFGNSFALQKCHMRAAAPSQALAGRISVPISRRHNTLKMRKVGETRYPMILLTSSILTSEGTPDRNVTASLQGAENTTIQLSYNWTSQSFKLAVPALIGMLADPLLSLVDTAYVGQVGSTELAALGACTSIFHLAFNAFRATTAATTSLVGNAQSSDERKQVIQLSLSFGIVLGVVVMTVLQLSGPWCLATMGVPSHSSLFPPAIAYLETRLWAAPIVLAIVVAEGAFRGYGDTKIPLLASLVASFINLILDPILMFSLGWGVKGAAAATGISQVGAALIYLFFLMKRGMLPKRKSKSVVNKSRVISTILGANLAMITKQGSLLLAWAYATAKATRIGSAHVAAHQVALSCWLVFALILDGSAVSAQVLMSRSLGNLNKVKSLILYMLRFAVLQGLATTLALLFVSPILPKLFTPDLAIRGHLVSLMPHLAWQQLLVSLTLVAESLAIGGNQFQLLAFGTTVSTILAMLQLQQATTVIEIWSKGIVTLFVGRLITALIGTMHVLRAQQKDRKLQAMQPQ